MMIHKREKVFIFAAALLGLLIVGAGLVRLFDRSWRDRKASPVEEPQEGERRKAIEEIEAYARSGDREQALVLLDRFIATHGVDDEAERLRQLLGVGDDALWEHEQALRFNQLLEEAQEALQEKRWNEALSLAKQALQYDASSRLAAEIRDEAERQKGEETLKSRLAEAQREYDAGNFSKALDLSGEILGTHPSSKEARHLFRKAQSARDQTWGEALLKQAKKRMQEKDYKKALELAERAKRLLSNPSPATDLIEKALRAQRRQRLSQLLKEANKALQRKEFERALSLAERSLEIDPHSEEAQRIQKETQAGLASLKAQKKRQSASPPSPQDKGLTADKKLPTLKEKAPLSAQKRAESLLLAARDRAHQSRLEEALVLANEALLLTPDSQEAKELVEKIEALRRKHRVESLLKEGKRFYEAGDLTEAQLIARKALKITPHSPEAQAFAKMLDRRPAPLKQEDRPGNGGQLPPDDSKKPSPSATERRPPLQESDPSEGEIFADQEKEDQVFQEGEEIKTPESAETLLAKAKMQARLGNWSRAIEEASKAVSLDSENPHLHHELGKLQYRAKRFEAALEAFKRVEALDPRIAANYFTMGLSQIQLQRDSEALASFQKGLALREDHAPSHWEVGKLLQKQERYAEAKVFFERARALSPKKAHYHRSLGSVLYELGEVEEAERTFQRATELDPSRAEAFYNLSLSQIAQDKYTQALPSVSTAVEKSPDNPRYLYTQGQVQEELGMLDLAEESYRRALKNDPNYVKPRINLGAIFDKQQKYGEALTILGEAYELAPSSSSVWNNLGNVYLHMGRYEKALSFYDDLAEREPNDPDLQFNRALSFLGLKNNTQVRKTLERVLEIDPNYWEAYYRLIQLSLAEGRIEEARNMTDNLLSRNPQYEKGGQLKQLLAEAGKD